MKTVSLSSSLSLPSSLLGAPLPLSTAEETHGTFLQPPSSSACLGKPPFQMVPTTAKATPPVSAHKASSLDSHVTPPKATFSLSVGGAYTFAPPTQMSPARVSTDNFNKVRGYLCLCTDTVFKLELVVTHYTHTLRTHTHTHTHTLHTHTHTHAHTHTQLTTSHDVILCAHDLHHMTSYCVTPLQDTTQCFLCGLYVCVYTNFQPECRWSKVCTMFSLPQQPFIFSPPQVRVGVSAQSTTPLLPVANKGTPPQLPQSALDALKKLKEAGEKMAAEEEAGNSSSPEVVDLSGDDEAKEKTAVSVSPQKAGKEDQKSLAVSERGLRTDVQWVFDLVEVES